MTTTECRVYVACLACYNDGRLHGVFVEGEEIKDADTIAERVKEMQAKCGHTDNDWAIHDYEGFNGIKLSESESFATVAALAAALEEHGEAFAVFYDYAGIDDVAKALEGFGDSYQGTHASLEEWAEQFLDDTGGLADVPDSLRNYIDFEKWARDAQYAGDIFTGDTADGVAVFWTNY